MKQAILLLAFLCYAGAQAFAQTSPADSVGVEKYPQPLNLDSVKKVIGYPVKARAMELDGTVVVEVLVDETGHYVRHVLKASPTPVLDEAVQAHLPAIRFSPGVVAGKPAQVWVSIPFPFRLIGIPRYDPNDLPAANSFHSLEEALNAKVRVYALFLNGKHYKTLPSEIFTNFPDLKWLDVSDNDLEVLSPKISNLTELRVLKIDKNELTALPNSLWELEKLGKVILDGNAFPQATQNKLTKAHGSLLYPKNEEGNPAF